MPKLYHEAGNEKAPDAPVRMAGAFAGLPIRFGHRLGWLLLDRHIYDQLMLLDDPRSDAIAACQWRTHLHQGVICDGFEPSPQVRSP